MPAITCRSSLLSDKRFLALLTTFLAGMGQGIVSPEMPDLARGASGSLAITIGFSAFLLYAGIFFSSFRFSKLADQGKVNRLLTGGLWSYALTLIGFSLQPTLTILMMLRFGEGLAISAILVSADYLLGRLTEEKERALWLSFYGVALSVGLLLGPVITILIGLNFALFGVATIALVLSALSFKKILISNVEEFIVAHSFSPALLIAALYGFLEASLVAIVPLIALEYFHQKPQWILVAAIVSAALFSIPLGLLGDRFKPKRVVQVLLVLLGLGSLAYASVWLGFPQWTGSLLLIFSVPVFFGILCGGFYPLGFAWLLEGYPSQQYGLASGRFTRYYGAGSLAGPLLLSLIYDRFQLAGFFFALAALGIVSGLILLTWKGTQNEVR